jgi:single-strand DNA-binding protein
VRDNSVTFIGRSSDAELNYGSSGTAYTRFSLGLYEGKNDDGSYKDSSWVDVVVFGEQAEQVANSIEKGDRVGVIGRITQDRWKNEEGENRTKLKVIADEVLVSLRWNEARVIRTDATGATRADPPRVRPGPTADPF